MTDTLCKFVPHSDIDTYLSDGWTIEMGGPQTHHEAYSVLMTKDAPELATAPIASAQFSVTRLSEFVWRIVVQDEETILRTETVDHGHVAFVIMRELLALKEVLFSEEADKRRQDYSYP